MKSAPILIIDRLGLIGEPLFLKLSKEFLTVFVSRNPLADVPFLKKFPVIPDDKYSHIIVIDEQGKDLEFLPKIINKALNVNADFILALGLSSKGKYTIDKIMRLYTSAKIVLVGDIFDKRLINREENFKSTVNDFIYQAQRFGKIKVTGEGLDETYPVFINDVVDGLIDLAFGVGKSRSLFYAFANPTTELSLAHMIQKANPEITIDFIKNNLKKESISFPPNGENLLGEKYQLAKKIRSINIKKKIKPQDKGYSQKENNRFKSIPLFIFWILIFLFFSPLIFTFLFSFLGLNTLYYAKDRIEKGNFSQAKTSLHLSSAFFSFSKETYKALYFQAKIINRENSLERFSEDIDLGHKISEGVLQAFNSADYFLKIFSGASKNTTDDFAKGASYLKGSIVTLEKAKAEGKIPTAILKNLEIIDPLIKFLSNTQDVLPSIFGMDGQKTYLILFQDNMQLRPSGGLINAYGILKVNMGKVTEFSVKDVADIDFQLRGHVEPPFAIRRYLRLEHWYMKDSNFDVDFVKSALSSSNFLFVEKGEKVDGVIGVDLSFVKNILHATGPVYVPEYRETVDENNIYTLAQKKNDFSKYLYKTTIAKISDKKTSYLLLAQALSNSLSQKHLMFSFNNNTQNVFTVNGWSSSLWDERKKDGKSVNDFLGINEANLGGNEVNFFILRNISQKVFLSEDGAISEELSISYKNNSTQLNEDYKNYLRIILPQNTTLSEVSINDNVQTIIDAVTDPLVYEAKNFKAPLGLEVEKVNEQNKTIYGFFVNVPAGNITKVKLKYVLPDNISSLSNFSYNIKIFKQPGIDVLPYSLFLTYPDFLNVVKNTDAIITGKENISYSKEIVGDKNLIINFAKK